MSMLKGLKLPRRGDRDSSTAAGKPPVVKIKKAQANELAILISRLQKNADQVEKDIIDTEDKLAIDIKNLENGREFQYRAKNAENLSRAEGSLKDLFLDSEQVKQLKHPQGEMINRDIHQLHDRWSKLCAEYRQVYEQVNIPNMRPQVDWLKMVGEKRYSLNRKGFGSDLVTVEMQMAEHNIIHKEIEAYGPHVKAAEGDPEYLRKLNEEYGTLLGTSTKRQKDLNELHTYMQRCTRELMWLDSEQEERKGMDWSDRNLDFDMRTRKYENIVNNELVAKEASINQIQDEGEKLLAAKHPAKPTIEAHMDAVENDWKRYLNLLICEEAHLKFMTEHHKFNKDAKESNEWLTKQSADMKRRYTVDPNDSALRVEELFKEVQEKEKEMDAYEKNVVALRNRATQIVPLKYRREKIPKPLTVETLCDYEDGELVLHRGDKYTLKDNSDKENWVVSNSAGKTETVPSACFVIPPTDPDSIALADGISTQFSELKQKRRETEAALRKRAGDVKQQAGQVLAADNSEERECVKHISDLERIYYELDDQEQQMLTKLRTPLDKNRPAEDGASRLREQDAILKRLQVLNTEKAKVVKSAEAFLSRKPKCPSAPKLRQKLDETDAKYTRVSLLANNYGDKAKAASGMEVSLQKAEGAIAPLERSLALEQSIPTDLAGIRTRRKELEAVKKDLGAKKALVLEEPARNLQNTQQHSQNIARNFNERCPDVERQESEVNRLRQRFGNMGDQTNLRLKELDNAEKTYSEYRGNYDNLNSWLDNVPKPSVSQNETVESINAKIADQKRLADELRRKETEKNKVEQLANDYQSTVRNYETASDRYRTLVEPEMVNGVNWDTNKSSPTRQVQDEERQLVKKFAEVSAANQQQIVYLQNMQNIVKNPPVQEVQARMSQQNLQKSEYSGPSKRDLELMEEEKKKRLMLEKDMESLKRQLDVAQQKAATPVKDPATEQEAILLRQQLQQEAENKREKDEELRLLRDRLQKSERAAQEAEQKVIIKEVSKVEKDPSKEREVNDLRIQMQNMTRQIEEEQNKSATAEKSIVMYERRIKEIEQQGPRVEKQVTIKEVPRIQQDPLLLKDLEEARRMLEQETAKNKAAEEELRLLRQRYSTLENTKPRVEVKEVVKEVVKADPNTERQAADLKRQLEIERQKNEQMNKEMGTLRTDLMTIQNRKPEVQVKEVVKLEKDPELMRNLSAVQQQLEEEISKKTSAEKRVYMLENKIKNFEEKPPVVEEKAIIKEVFKVETDPQTTKELANLKQMLDEEFEKNKVSKKEILMLQQKYTTLENTKPKVEIKEITKEVVRADPETERQAADLKKQLAEEKRKSEKADRELDALRIDVEALRNRKPEVQVKEVVKVEKDPEVVRELNKVKQQLEDEIESRKATEKKYVLIERRIKEVEQAPPKIEERLVIKEVAKVERDPKLEEEVVSLRKQLQQEIQRSKISQEEIQTIQHKFVTLENTKPKVEIKEVIKEVVRADPETERQAADLKKQLAEEKRKSEKADRELNTLRIDVEALRNRKPEVQVKEVSQGRERSRGGPKNDSSLRRSRRWKETQNWKKRSSALGNSYSRRFKDQKYLRKKSRQFNTNLLPLKTPNLKWRSKKSSRRWSEQIQRQRRQAADLKKQLAEEKRKSEKADRELNTLRIDVEALRNRKPEVQVKEVIKVEKDPEVVRELNKVKQQLEDEVESRKATEKKYVLIERRIKEVEQAPPKVEERIVIKEVTKVEKDPQTEQDLVNLKRKLEDEIQRNQVSQKEINLMQQKYTTLENTKPKVEIKEITKEVVRADPETERQAAELRRQLADEKRASDKAERELSTLRRELEALKNKKPEVQVKEVVKVERDPEQEREIVKLKNTLENERKKKSMAEEENDSLQQKILMLENRKPKVEIKEVVHEILKADPQTEKEAAEYKRQLEQEKRKLKDSERELASLRTDLNELRNRKPDVQIKEVVKVQRDPEQDKEINKLTKSLDEESRRNRKFEDEIHYLKESLTKLENTKPKVEIKEVVREVVKADPETERQAVDLKRKLTAEKERYDTVMGELNTLRIELNSLRNRKPDVQIKEVVKLEKDPELERELKQLKRMYEEEIEKNRDAQRDLVSVRRQYTILEKEKPKVEIQEVLREVVRPDPETEKEASELRLQMMQIKGQLSNAEREALKLREEVKTLQNRKPEIQVKEVLKETVKFEKNPAAEEEVTRMKKELDREMQKRTDAELQLTKLQNRIFNLENQPPKIEEKVVIQESIQYKTDPNLEREVDSLKKSLNQEKKRQQSLEEDLGQLRSTVSEQKQLITQLRTDSQEKNELEQELRRTKNRMTTLEQQKSKVEEKVVYKEVVKVEQDPEVMKEAVLLRSQLNDERSKRNRLEDEVDRMKARMHDLEIEATKEKIVYKEVVKIEKDKMVDSELEKLRGQLDDELRMRRNKERELQKQSEVISDVQSEIEKLKRKLTDTDKVINSKEGEIVALRDKLSRLENRQPEVTRTSTEKTQSHLSRKIVVMDPETGKEMTPYEAYKLDLIDWKTYSQLAGQECDWEEVSVSGPKGISSSLRDKKTGTKFSIEDALASGKVTQHDVQQYKNRKMTIAEFAAKVSGQTFKPQPEKEEGVKKTNSSQVSSSLPRESAQSKDSTVLDLETPPIAGVFDVDTNQKMQIKTAISKNLIDPITAQKLLEAQAATGGIIDVVNGEKYSVHKAADMNLIDSSSVQRLLGAQKAYTGIEDPTTKERLPVGIALKRGWLYQDAAYKYLEAQFLTGGLVDPNKAGRVPVGEALALGIIDNEAKRALEDDKSHPKDITDPISKKRLTYKEALNQCKVESSTGLPLLKVSSKSSGGSSRFTR
ncbi:envoplakin [Lethenteron reissneri]|uniref:envoplakin n=1 Tax=Lethenteron reissneri TaxID=7753 RepID=UPI002AB7483C|nr:envoplakin [Lethenteron reissneri]